MDMQYTNRKIAIFTDIHGLNEPLEAVINDVIRRGITEIYSLGDNIGVGPSPCEVIDNFIFYDIKSVAGNAEEYCNLGIASYSFYFDSNKFNNYWWTKDILSEYRLNYIKNLPHSYDINIGGKKLALCHFANDVRTDYGLNNVDKYLFNYRLGEGYKQFLYTNSNEHKESIEYNLNKYGFNNVMMRGYLSARDYPIFNGKTVDEYDAIIQGHVHRNLYEKGNDIDFFTIRAMALHFDEDPIDKAFYIILHEKINNMGFDLEKVYVPFDRERMEYTINKSSEPTGKIKRMVRML